MPVMGSSTLTVTIVVVFLHITTLQNMSSRTIDHSVIRTRWQLRQIRLISAGQSIVDACFNPKLMNIFLDFNFYHTLLNSEREMSLEKDEKFMIKVLLN